MINLCDILSREGNIMLTDEEKPSEEYIAWMKSELLKFINRQDPDRTVYSEEEIKAKYGVK